MRTGNKNTYTLAAIILAACLSIFCFVSYGARCAVAYGAVKSYTDVLTDLRMDEKFTAADYTTDAADYSLQVIQIAESVDGELFVYVYQPSHFAKDLTATSINISGTTGGGLRPENYKLRLLSSAGVFDKYLVEGFAVSDAAVRYYEIISIYRAWDSELDKGTGNDNTINEVAYEVGQKWTACTVNGETLYGYTYTDVITITDKYCGVRRYYNGFKFFPDSCDAHYVAFSTDKRMDRLIEAEVEYKAMPKFNGVPMYDEPLSQKAVLSEMDEVSTKADGLFAKKYTWNRIESASDFRNGKELTDEELKGLAGKQWVLSFCETEYTEKTIAGVITVHEVKSTEITAVTILRLEFETDGVVYNLGVVDNKQSGSNIPGNKDGGSGFWAWLYNELFVKRTPWVWAVTVAVVLVVLIFLTKLLSLFIPVFVPVWGVVWAVICAPFRFIAWCVRKISERRERGKQTKQLSDSKPRKKRK